MIKNLTKVLKNIFCFESFFYLKALQHFKKNITFYQKADCFPKILYTFANIQNIFEVQPTFNYDTTTRRNITKLCETTTEIEQSSIVKLICEN